MGKLQRETKTPIVSSDVSLGYQETRLGRTFQAVEGVSFAVPKGSTLGVLGESGSGKSTLARFFAGRGSAPSAKSDRIQLLSGEGACLGVPLSRLSTKLTRQLHAYVGFLEQDAGAKLSPDRNVGDLIFQPIEERIRKFDRAPLGELVAEMFDIVALPLTMLQKYPYELSKGQRQRVAVVRSLMLEPPVYIADEPTLGVDANNRPRIVELITWHRERTNATCLIVSHDITLLEALIHDVLVLQEGSAVGYADINEIFRFAEHPYVRQLADALRSNAYDEVAGD